jgi:hypothetical protein
MNHDLSRHIALTRDEVPLSFYDFEPAAVSWNARMHEEKTGERVESRTESLRALQLQ